MPVELGAEQLAGLCESDVASAAPWLQPLWAAMGEAGIDTPARCAAFLAQVIHESGGLRHLSENLAYSAARLAQVWPRHFYLAPDEPAGRLDAQGFDHQPEALANVVYANRLGNGDSASGDGWRYRGRGLIQLTGRDHYAGAAQSLALPLLDNPDLLLEPAAAARSAAWFWNGIGGNGFADEDSDDAFARLTQAINGGEVGEPERLALWKQARALLEPAG